VESGFISLVAVVGVFALIFVSINWLVEVTKLVTITIQRNVIHSHRLIRRTTDIYMVGAYVIRNMQSLSSIKTVDFTLSIWSGCGNRESDIYKMAPRRESVYRTILHRTR
jgi:hypothetical protein